METVNNNIISQNMFHTGYPRIFELISNDTIIQWYNDTIKTLKIIILKKYKCVKTFVWVLNYTITRIKPRRVNVSL